MRALVRTLILALLLLAPAWAEEGGTPGGTVSLPLEDFLRMTAPAAPGSAPQGPLQAHLFSNGRSRVEAGREWAIVETRLDLAIYRGGWQEVPLLPSGSVLTEVSLDGRPVPVYEKEGFFRFLARGRGNHAVRVVSQARVSGSGAARGFDFVSPPGALSSVRLLLSGTGLRVEAEPKAPLVARAEGGRTVVEGALRGGQATRLTWSPRVAERGQASGQKARVEARLYTLAEVTEREIRCRTHVDFTIQRNEIDSLTLGVPTGAEVVEVQGPSVAGWEVVDRPGVRQVNVSLSKPVTGSLPLDLSVALPLRNVNSTWELPWVQVAGAERVRGSLAVATSGAIEVSQPDEPEGARAIDPSEVPPQVQQLGTALPVLAYEYHGQPWSIRLESRLGQAVPLLTAAVDHGEGVTLVTPEGKTISTFTWTLRNNQNQYLEVRLPEGARLWSAFVDGRAVKPLESGGALKLPLVSSQGTGDGLSSFPVEITFVGAEVRRAWVGRQAMEAPQLVGVPISQLDWSLYLPRDRELLGFGGTMEPSDEPPAPPRQAQAIPEARGANEVLSEEAQSKDEVAAPAPAAGAAGALELSKAKADKPAESAMAQMVQTASQGSFPVRVRVPLEGQPHRFTQLMVGAERPTVVVRFYTQHLLQAARWGAFLLVLALGFRATRRPAGWKPLAGTACALFLLGAFLAGTPGGPLVGGAAWGLTVLALLWLVRHRRWLVDFVKTRVHPREVPS